MSFLSNVGSGLIRWTPNIVEVSADDIARFGPQAARVRALLNFIPTMSDDAIQIGRAAYDPAGAAALYGKDDAYSMARHEVYDAAYGAARGKAYHRASAEASNAAVNPVYSTVTGSSRRAGAMRADALKAASDAGEGEVVSDLITPEVYRTLTNPMASVRALDRLAGRAPESFVPIARDLGERGLVAAPSDIVSAFRISKLPPHVQPLVTGLVDSGLTLEEAIAAARALS